MRNKSHDSRAVEKLVSQHPTLQWQPPIKDIAQLPRVIEVRKSQHDCWNLLQRTKA